MADTSLYGRYLGLVDFSVADQEQRRVRDLVRSGICAGRLLGFESHPVVTIGRRGTARDLLAEQALNRRGYKVQVVDRGGETTLHNPGQLVIFPVWPLKNLRARSWIELVAIVTRRVAARMGTHLTWRPERPGLYHAEAKVVSMGFRLSQGVSTHGLAINIYNDLEEFGLIRTCGIDRAVMARLQTSLSLRQVFYLWCEEFLTEVDKVHDLEQFNRLAPDVRL